MKCAQCAGHLTEMHYQLRLVPGGGTGRFCSLDCVSKWCEDQIGETA